MAKDKDSGIDKLKKKKGFKPLPKKDLTKFTGGRKKRPWTKGCGGITPQ